MTTISLEKPKAQPRLNYAQVAPATLQGMLALSDVVKKSGLEESLLHLVDIRVSQINGCAFCLDMHIREAKAVGEADDRINLISAWREVDLYTDRERVALQWAESLTRLADGHVSDDDFAAVREEFTEAELANLSLAIVAINGWNRLNVGFKVPPGFGD
ncbi:MAG: carboxymuconolactone decarboxylase family protein [Nibricoccus sp.]